MTETAIIFVVGAFVGSLAVIPACVSLILVVRFALRLAESAYETSDQYAASAVGANVAAAVAQQTQPKVKAGSIHSVWHGDEDDDDDAEDGDDNGCGR